MKIAAKMKEDINQNREAKLEKTYCDEDNEEEEEEETRPACVKPLKVKAPMWFFWFVPV